VLTVDGLIEALGINPASDKDVAWATTSVAGINAYVNRLPHVKAAGEVWDDSTTLGATLLAQRAYAARGAPLGAAGLDVTGAMVRATTDPEVGRYLRIGRYARPRAG
jgi:hypothetical protein